MRRIDKVEGLSRYGKNISELIVKVSDIIKRYSKLEVQEKVNPLERVIIGEMIMKLLEEYVNKIYDTDLKINFSFLQLEFGENPETEKTYQLYKIFLN